MAFSRTINMTLSNQSINKAIESLRAYKADVNAATLASVRELLRIGWQAANEGLGPYDGQVTFTDQIAISGSEIDARLVGTGIPQERTWKSGDGWKTVFIDPLLMAEFGSGWEASPGASMYGFGQGTFPGQIHAFDPDGWYWVGEDNELNHSTGEAPTYPLEKAWATMYANAQSVMTGAFGRG